MALQLLNRDPEPNEIDVPIDSLVSVDIADPNATGVSVAATEVYVNGSLAYDGNGGGFQTGFDGPGSATSNPDASTLRVVIDPVADFASEEVVTVRVVSDDLFAAQPLDSQYSFTTADVVVPELLAASAKSKTVVRVVFNEPVKRASATAIDDALNPSNYIFTRATRLTVDVVASSVVEVNSTTFDVSIDIEMTPGGTYVLTVSNVEDESDNQIAAPNNSSSFVGFQPQIPAGRSFNLWDWIPGKNKREDSSGDLRDFIGVLQEVVDLLLCKIDEYPGIFDPDTAPESFVDAMLLDLGNPFAFDLSLIDKRRLLRVLVDIYRLKGTCVGIQAAVRFFVGVEVTCDEYNTQDVWILGVSELDDGTDVADPPAILAPSSQFNLYAFALVSAVLLTDEQRDQIDQICEYMKPAHTHCVEIIEPIPPTPIDHWEIGLSEIGVTTDLH